MAKEYFRLWPQGPYEDQNDVVLVKDKYVTLTAGGANQNVVSAVTGKRIIVVSISVDCVAAAAVPINFRDGSGGTFLLHTYVPSNASATPNVIYPHNIAGWMRTTAGTALVCDVGAGGNINLFLNYIESP